jgi:hypothetical protein
MPLIRQYKQTKAFPGEEEVEVQYKVLNIRTAHNHSKVLELLSQNSIIINSKIHRYSLMQMHSVIKVEVILPKYGMPTMNQITWLKKS